METKDVKRIIIENWILHTSHKELDGSIRKHINQYVEEDHVNEIEQSGRYDVSDIDWELLKKQKKSLLEVVDCNDNVEQVNELEGIINLINSLQDFAVDKMGIEESIVFQIESE